MEEALMRLVEGAVQVHCTASNTRDAKREFGNLIKQAYTLGFQNAEKTQIRQNKKTSKKVTGKGQNDGKEKASDKKGGHEEKASDKEKGKEKGHEEEAVEVQNVDEQKDPNQALADL